MTDTRDSTTSVHFPSNDPDDPLAAIEGRNGARLFALSGETGKVLAEQPLEAPPVWDGMIACRRRLYLGLQNGVLLCLGQGPETQVRGRKKPIKTSPKLSIKVHLP